MSVGGCGEATARWCGRLATLQLDGVALLSHCLNHCPGRPTRCPLSPRPSTKLVAHACRPPSNAHRPRPSPAPLQSPQVHARNKKLDAEVKLEEMAMRTPGFSGADLANLLNEAAILAGEAMLRFPILLLLYCCFYRCSIVCLLPPTRSTRQPSWVGEATGFLLCCPFTPGGFPPVLPLLSDRQALVG